MAVVARLFESPEIRYTPEDLRVIEALLFAAAEPMEEASLAERLPIGCDVKGALAELQRQYAGRGVQVVRLADPTVYDRVVGLHVTPALLAHRLSRDPLWARHSRADAPSPRSSAPC